MKNFILFDWFSFTCKTLSVGDVISLLGLEGVNWEMAKGAQGYKDRQYFDKISIHFNGGDDMGVWCEMSGHGCRVFETYGNGDFDTLFCVLLSNPDEFHITRLDIAFDDHTDIFDIKTIFNYTFNEWFSSKFKTFKHTGGSAGYSVDFGSNSSEALIRIYDKAAERKKNNEHWVRCELQLRRDRASEFISKYIEYKNLGYLFSASVNNYLRFCEPSNDTNKSRWATSVWWDNFLQTTDKISLFVKPGVEYNTLKLKEYVVGQAGNAIATYVDLFGYDGLERDLKARTTKPNSKYDLLKQQFLHSEDNFTDDEKYYSWLKWNHYNEA